MKGRLIHDDRLCQVFRLPNGDCHAKGKRVPASNPLTYEERRMYVAELARSAFIVKNLMNSRNISLSEAWELVKSARAPAYQVNRLGERRKLH